jgi:Tol biopolymer transport system component
VDTGTTSESVSCSPDGKYIAVVNYGSDNLMVFSFSGGVPVNVMGAGGVTTGEGPTSVSWSPDGKYLAVANTYYGTMQVFSFLGEALSEVATTGTGGWTPMSASWSPDGKYMVVVNANLSNTHDNNMQPFFINYQTDITAPTLSNCITLGNSALGQVGDVDIRLAGASDIEINGFVNHDAA